MMKYKNEIKERNKTSLTISVSCLGSLVLTVFAANLGEVVGLTEICVKVLLFGDKLKSCEGIALIGVKLNKTFDVPFSTGSPFT